METNATHERYHRGGIFNGNNPAYQKYHISRVDRYEGNTCHFGRRAKPISDVNISIFFGCACLAFANDPYSRSKLLFFPAKEGFFACPTRMSHFG